MLYNSSFLQSIPSPQSDECRSLVNIKAYHPHILNLIDKWFTEEIPDGDSDLEAKLQQIENPIDFTSAFWELVILRYLRKNNHKIIFHEKLENGTCPEFFWKDDNITGDVFSISDPKFLSTEDKLIRQLLQEIENANFQYDIILWDYHLKQNSYKKNNIIQWLNKNIQKFNTTFSKTYIFEDEYIAIKFTIGPSEAPSKITTGKIVELNSKQLKTITRRRINKKLQKYSGNLILFACAGLGIWNLNEDILKDVLFGDEVVIFDRNNENTDALIRRKPNGIFYNRINNGSPAHTRLLTVVFADRRVSNSTNSIALYLKALHNPYAIAPLSTEFFGNVIQLVISNINENTIDMDVINTSNSLINIY